MKWVNITDFNYERPIIYTLDEEMEISYITEYEHEVLKVNNIEFHVMGPRRNGYGVSCAFKTVNDNGIRISTQIGISKSIEESKRECLYNYLDADKRI